MKPIVPTKLQPGAHIRVISPSRSMALIGQETQDIAKDYLARLGFRVSYSENIFECDEFVSSSVASRLADLHEAFRDPDVDAILTTIGGWNCNQILNGIDFELIRRNPKVICGYSDITILLNAIYTQTGILTYYGPHFSTFGALKGNEFTHRHFFDCVAREETLAPGVSPHWSEDAWFLDQENRDFLDNPGWVGLSDGSASGTLLGGHLGTFTLLQGTAFRPSAEKVILFFEEDQSNGEQFELEWDRCLEAVLLQVDLGQVVGLVMGRFPGFVSKEKMYEVIRRKPQLQGIPIVSGLDFGHTMPMVTLPIGGHAHLSVNGNEISFEIDQH